MLEHRGLDEAEARTAVEEIDEAITNKERVFSNKEAIKLLPRLVREANLTAVDFLKLSREVHLTGKMRPVKLNYISLESQGRQSGREGGVYSSLRNISHDISQFYSDRGPDTDPERILEEEMRRGENTRYVLKERESDQNGARKSPAVNDLKPSSERISTKKIKKVQPTATSGLFNEQRTKATETNTNKTKPSSKWPEVQPSYINNHQPNNAKSIINQLNSLTNSDPEITGPFNFKKLLRRTKAAATHSLRLRQNIATDFVQDLEGDIQNL